MTLTENTIEVMSGFMRPEELALFLYELIAPFSGWAVGVDYSSKPPGCASGDYFYLFANESGIMSRRVKIKESNFPIQIETIWYAFVDVFNELGFRFGCQFTDDKSLIQFILALKESLDNVLDDL